MSGSSAGPNPYVGPRPFETGERLYGRERELSELLCLLGAERIVLLHSPSGAGKSSLVQAGLIPRLRERFDVWRPTRVGHPPPDNVPKDSNRYSLSAALGFEQGIPEDLRRPPAALAGLRLDSYVGGRPRRPSAPPNVLLIFDQFEEVLTADPLAIDEKREFFAQLGEVLQDPVIWALFLLREDYLAPLDPYAQQVPTHLRNRYRIDLLGLDAAQDAIVQPATGLSRRWTEPAAQRLVRDLATVKVQQADGRFREQVGLHVEPMQLQVVCRGLWDRMPDDDLSVDPEDVESFGNVTHALGGYYAGEVRRIAGDDAQTERSLREWVGEALITSDGIRCPVLRAAGASAGLANALVERLVDAHLVRADDRGGAIWYELAHDRLVGPVRVDNERWAQANLQPVQVQAALWARQAKPSALLLSEEALEAAERWVAGLSAPLGEPDLSFIADSRAARAQQRAVREAQAQALKSAQELAESQARAAVRQRRFTRLAWLLSALALTAAGVSYSQFKEAGAQAERAEAASKVAVEQAARAAEAAARARDQSRIATSGAAADPTIQAVLLREVERPTETRLWLQMVIDLRQRPIAQAVLEHEDGDSSSSFSPDGSRVVVVSARGKAQVRPIDGDGEVVALTGHGGRVTSAAFSADGGRIVTTSEDRTARVWRVDGAGEPVVLTGHTDAILSAAFSADGARIVTTSADGTARVWRSEGVGEPVVLAGHEGKVFSAAFSADGARVATIAEDRTARVWRVEGQGEPLLLSRRDKKADKPLAASVSFSPDGTRIVMTLADKVAWLWQADRAGKPVELSGHDDVVHGAAFSPDGARIVTASADRTARVWQVGRAGDPVVLAGHEGGVRSATFSPDGGRVVTAAEDGSAWIWRADGAGVPVILAGHASRVSSAAFSSDGRRVFTNSGDRAAVWQAEGAGEPIVRTGYVPREAMGASASFSPDGSRVVFVGEKTATLWRADGAGEPVELKGHDDDVLGALFSPDGSRVVTASKDRTARVWRADGAGEPVVLKGHEGPVVTAVFSPDGKRVVTASTDRTARVWRADGAGDPVVLAGHKGEAMTAMFSPDGSRVVTAAGDRAARLWRADGGGEPVELTEGESDISRAGFSPDGSRVAAILSDQTLRVWRTDGTGQPLVLKGHEGVISMIAFSPDGRRLVSASLDRTARVWPLDGSGEPVVLAGHKDELRSAWFSADGARIVTASLDATARVWRADGTGEALVLTGHEEGVHWAAFSPDGTRVMTASEDRTVRVWTLRSPQEYIDYLWQATTYCLREDQRVDRLGETRDESITAVRACKARVGESAAKAARR